MRAVKIAVAIALLLFAALLALGDLQMVTHNIASTFHQHVGTNLLVAICLCMAYMLLRMPIDPVADVHCPRCRTLVGHKFAPQYRGSISHAALHFGGFLFSIFIQAAGNSAFVVVASAKSYSIHIQCSLGVIVFYFCCLLRSL